MNEQIQMRSPLFEISNFFIRCNRGNGLFGYARKTFAGNSAGGAPDVSDVARSDANNAPTIVSDICCKGDLPRHYRFDLHFTFSF